MNLLFLLILCINILNAYEIANIDSQSVNNALIPPSLLFDMIQYYRGTTQIKCFYIDYSKLSFIDLSELDNITASNNTILFTFCKEKDFNEKTLSFKYNNDTFTINTSFSFSYLPSIKNKTTLKLNSTAYNDTNSIDINIIYECKLNDSQSNFSLSNNTLTVEINNQDCKHLFTFHFIFHNSCGIFGYAIISLGIFCLIYGYSNGTISIICYSIIAAFEIIVEIFDFLNYNFFYYDQQIFYIIIMIGIFIIGGIFGLICSMSFQYRKLIFSWFTGKVIYNFVFYLIIIPSFKSIEIDLFIIRELVLLGSLGIAFVFFVFVNEKGKYAQLITALSMNMIGTYFLMFVGINFIGGKLPFDYAVVYSNKYKKQEKQFFENLTNFWNYASYFIFYVVIFIAKLIVMEPIKNLIQDKSVKPFLIDTDEDEGKELPLSAIKSQNISKTGVRSSDDDYE